MVVRQVSFLGNSCSQRDSFCWCTSKPITLIVSVSYFGRLPIREAISSYAGYYIERTLVDFRSIFTHRYRFRGLSMLYLMPFSQSTTPIL